jgi:tryptophan halogenase
MKILVVGGGTAGFISALILKKFLNIEIDVVYSEKIGIIVVGEGSTEHFTDFLNFMELDKFSILQECDATFKSGIMFENWTPDNYLHSVITPFNIKQGMYPVIYSKQISEQSNELSPICYWENKISSWFVNNKKDIPFLQYHFNTYKLNSFLTKTASNYNINTINDEIKNITFKENGEIDYLTGEKQNYKYDFYIDATGFQRLLIGKMGAKWISFSKYLKMKSAIVFPSQDEEEYNLWTLSKAMDYGWRFKIPTWGRHGNGYIFDSDYITADQAKEELDKEFGYDVEIKKEFKFDPGYLENVWIKNCVAIGLSGSFVEPLEATSIGSTIQQSYLLMHKLLNYSDKEIDSYNKNFQSIMENIRDFVALHYVVKKNSTSFWKDIQNIEMPESLQNNLEIWKNKIPIREDFSNQSNYCLFWEDNFTLVIDGLGLFNQNSIKKEYNLLNQTIKNFADKTLLDYKNIEKNSKYIGHKQYIHLTRKFL